MKLRYPIIGLAILVLFAAAVCIALFYHTVSQLHAMEKGMPPTRLQLEALVPLLPHKAVPDSDIPRGYRDLTPQLQHPHQTVFYGRFGYGCHVVYDPTGTNVIVIILSYE